MAAEPLSEPTSAAAPAASGTRLRGLALCCLPGVLLALALYAPSRAAGWISDDAAALGYVTRSGSLADWTQPQYGLESIRFWRPLVTSSIGWIAELAGPAAAPQRAFNLLCALASLGLGAGLAGRLVPARLGRAARSAAMLSAGVLLASFPHQGGVTTWIVGRVDGLCLPFVLGAGWAAAAGRGWLAALACALAIATKEMGFVAPVVALGAAFAAGGPAVASLRAALPSWLVSGLLVALRAHWIGDWVGGYASPAAPDLGRLRPAAREVLAALGPGVLAAPLALLLAVLAGARPWRAAVGLLAGVAGSLTLLAPLLLGGGLLLEHRRWLLVPDALLAVLAAVALGYAVGAVGAVGAGARVAARAAGLALVAGALVWRVPAAQHSVGAWVGGAAAAQAFTASVRAAAQDLAPSEHPVLVVDVPRTTTDGEAYVLHWGFADRFRAPFESLPRPVWPWRTIFGQPDSERGPTVLPRGGLRYPNLDPLPRGLQRSVPALELRVAGEPASGPLRFELEPELLAPGAGPVLELRGSYPCPRLEVLLFTALGYEPATWTGAWPPVDGALELSLRDLLLSPGRVPLSETLALAADVGERVVYLELRAVDDERGQTNRPIAASPWLRLELTDAFADALCGRVFAR